MSLAPEARDKDETGHSTAEWPVCIPDHHELIPTCFFEGHASSSTMALVANQANGPEMARIEERWQSLGIDLPPAPAPAADYVPWLITGSLLFISGQVAQEGGKFICGQVKDEQDLARAQYAARSCGIALLAQARDAAGGNLDRIARVIRIGGFVNASPGFTQHASVMNGCSKLMLEVFGENGHHVRAAVGSSLLPRGVMVEAEAVFELQT